ncbi:MAG: histidine--tRNA ligase [Deltaproteobacteria bacterium]|nr:histidine--tRNA ligase [Deltaproteobacteria bacterium]
MSKGSTKPPSGTRDFLPVDIARRRYVVGIIQEVYEQYGFVPLETPAFENLTALLGKYGDEGDQLLYRLLHRRDALKRALDKENVTEADLADLGLRYDLTVPLARVVAQYRDLPRFFKRYQIQPVWRADRPGRGRFREFYQCDVDVVGTESLVAEAETLAAIAQVLERLGFDAFELRINHRRLLRALIQTARIPLEKEQTALVAVDKLDKIGHEGVIKELAQRGVAVDASETLLQLLEATQGKSKSARFSVLRERVTNDDGQAALTELEELFELLEQTPAGAHALLSPELARGLSYYTGPIFEIIVEDLAGSLGGGGRYDELIGMFGKNPIPAVGGSIGLERILLVMQERGMYPPLPGGPELLLCWFGVESKDAVAVAHQLRAEGLRVETYPAAVKLGKQLQYAAQSGVPFAAILGADELSSGTLGVKNLETGEQQKVTVEAVKTIVRA